MGDLRVTLGSAARAELCSAFDSARDSIEAQFYSIGDASIVASLNDAARRGVAVTLFVEGDRGRYAHRGEHVPQSAHVRDAAAGYEKLFDRSVHVIVEGDELVLEHGKAAVVDGSRAFIATANPNADGFSQPGEVLVEDRAAEDVAVVRAAIEGRGASSQRIIAGPDAATRQRIASLFDAPVAERVAMEDLSDPQIVGLLIARRQRGLHDEVLVKREGTATSQSLRVLAATGVALRTLPGVHMHEKYIDAGDRIYIGSANLTRNGLDEAREVGIIAPAADFGDGATMLRADFDRMWSRSEPVLRPGPPKLQDAVLGQT